MGSDTMQRLVRARPAEAGPYALGCVLGAIFALVLSAPAFAQAELAGSWAQTGGEDLSGDTVPVDYTGIPLNEEGRVRALSYNESQLEMIERQCQGLPVFYFLQGPFGLKIWSDAEPVKGDVVSYTIGAWENRAPFVIWMDGRPHPSPLAEHTRGGFTTGHWDGNTLVAYTTHLKANFIRKIGPPMSDETTLTTRFYRHGDILTVLAVIEDPAYLTEPMILTKSFQLQATELSAVGPPCVSAYQGRVPGDPVPHFVVPEQNPFIDEMTTRYGVPRAAALGMPETLYPEYRKKIKTAPRPETCTINCVSGAPPSQR